MSLESTPNQERLLHLREAAQVLAYGLTQLGAWGGFYEFVINLPNPEAGIGFGTTIASVTVFGIFSRLNMRRVESLRNELPQVRRTTWTAILNSGF